MLDINFRSSATYIDMRLLYPLDKYVESMAGVTLKDGSALSNEDYFAALRKGSARRADQLANSAALPGRDAATLPIW